MTGDWPSYRHPRSGEWAHEVRDPAGQAREVFVAPAWRSRPPRPGQPLRILEVGFGRGLNTATALRELGGRGWQGEVRAYGLEPHPERLEPWGECPEEWRPWMPWWGAAAGRWTLPRAPRWQGVIVTGAAPQALALVEPCDWIFLDLFSPALHPEEWPAGLYRALREVAGAAAVLTSYCCARCVRDGLEQAGWRVERRRTPGRKDSLRACLAGASPGQ